MTGADSKSDTRIMKLFREWARMTEEIDELVRCKQDEECERRDYARDVIEHAILEWPSETAADFAAKAIIETSRGEGRAMLAAGASLARGARPGRVAVRG